MNQSLLVRNTRAKNLLYWPQGYLVCTITNELIDLKIDPMKKVSFLLAMSAFIFSCTSPHHDLLITNVFIIDVATGEILPNRTVAIDGDEITAIYTKSIKPGKQTVVVDGSGKYLIPGLWDMHVHHNWNYDDTNELLLANGVTGAREMWGDMGIKRKMEEERAAGKPIIDIYTAGVIIDGAPQIWPGSDEVTDPADAAALVRCQIEQGADFIKIYSRLDSACFYAIAETAKELGVPFAGHVPVRVPIADATAAGMHTMEHLYGLEQLAAHDTIVAQSNQMRKSGKYVEGLFHILTHIDTVRLDQGVAELVKTGTWFSPTMVTARGFYFQYDSAFTADQRVKYLPKHLIWNWYPSRMFGPKPDGKALAMREALWQLNLAILRSLVRNGASIIAGTDYPNSWSFPGFGLHDELDIYVQAGMTPLQALQTAALNPSKVMNNEKIGGIEKGKLASLVLLNSNPLDDINALRHIESVILRGSVYDRNALDAMLANAKRRASLPGADQLIETLRDNGQLSASLHMLETRIDSLSAHYCLTDLEWEINRLGYSLLADSAFAEAQEVFALNTRMYSHSQNVWDSYGDSFLQQGDTATAMIWYQKALDIYPCTRLIEAKLLDLRPQQSN